MRIRWESSVENVKCIAIDVYEGCPCYIGGRNFFDDEWQYWARVKEESFPNRKAMEDWVGVMLDGLAEHGYIDLRDETHIEIL